MKIGFLCSEYPPCNNGGIGTYTKLMAEGIANRGHQVVVFGLYRNQILEINKEEISIINNVKIIRWPFIKYTHNHNLNELINRIILHFKIKKIILKENLEIIEAYDSEGLMPFKCKVPLITRLHGSITYFGRELVRPYSRFISFFEKRQLSNSNLLVGVSNYVLVKTLEYFQLRNKGLVSYNSVYPKQNISHGYNEGGKKVILYFGSIIPKKGVEELVLAFNELLKTRNDIALRMIGKSSVIKNGIPYKEYLYSLVDGKKNNEFEIIDHLKQDALENEIKKSYCCVFPSFIECFAISPMEAMAFGKPIIYSELHSGPELINNGKNGLLVNPNSQIQIIDSINFLLDNKAEAEKLGENGYATVCEKFDINKWILENEEIFKNQII